MYWKTYVLTIALLLSFANVHAQITSATLDLNNVKVVVNANGAMFTDFDKGQFIAPYEPGQPEISTLRAAGIWLGGLDPGANLKGAIQLYNENGKTDFQPGTLDPDDGSPTGLLTDIYRVTAEDVNEHLADFADNGIIDNPNPNVYGWPARGNPFFDHYHNGEILPNTFQGLAGFWDQDGDGIYDPSQGDFPTHEVRGCDDIPLFADEILWFVFNDNVLHSESMTLPLKMEIQCEVFAYNCLEAPIGNTIFTRYKLINRAKENIDSTYFGFFSDFDIGNPEDDYFGSDPYRALIFGYNGDDNDENGYEANIPVMSVDLLRGPLNAFAQELGLAHVMPVDPDALTQATAYYNLLSGHFPDGSQTPNNGFFYDGNPNNPDEWSEVTENNTPGNRRVLGSSGPFLLQPGAINELLLAYTFTQVPGNTPLENISEMYKSVDAIQTLFDSCFDIDFITQSGLNIGCTPTVSSVTNVQSADLSIYPNPAGREVVVELEQTSLAQLSLLDLHGRQWMHFAIEKGTPRLNLDLAGIPNGMYLLAGHGADGTVFRQKLIVAR